MRRALPSVALVLALSLAAPAASQQHGGGSPKPGSDSHADSAGATTSTARFGFGAIRPQRLDVLTGESVTWINGSVRAHTATADDHSFDSGLLAPSQSYRRRFVSSGEHPYHCRLHPSMRGVVGVHDLLLATPGQAAAPNRPFPLAGRAALEGGTAVSIEADAGSGYTPLTSATVGDDGRFAARIVPTATASYRAVAGGVTSRSVRVLVLDRRISLTVHRLARERVRLRATVSPASRGGRIVLQLFLPERFGWWPVQTARLGKDSGATFTLRATRRLRARVRYTLPDGATALATSRTVRIGPPARAERHR